MKKRFIFILLFIILLAMPNESKAQEYDVEEVINVYDEDTTIFKYENGELKPAGIDDDWNGWYVLSKRLYCNDYYNYNYKIEATCYFNYGSITKIGNLSLDRRSTSGITKQFEGKISAEILNGNEILYLIDGDFYNYGETVVGFEGGIDEVIYLTYKIEHKANHYETIYERGRLSKKDVLYW